MNVGESSSAYEAGKPSNEYVLNVAFFSFIGFVVFQAVFALIARSEAMLADSEAMSVDALTYLLNLLAERIKNKPFTEEEMQLDLDTRLYKRELRRLYLELFPPTLSVITLIAVTVVTMREAVGTLRGGYGGDEEEVSIRIMLFFSSANLLLDVVNVTCFARANMNFGLSVVQRETASISESLRGTWSAKLVTDSLPMIGPLRPEERGSATEETHLVDSSRIIRETRPLLHLEPRRLSSSSMVPHGPHDTVNLNMCSAWTVRLLMEASYYVSSWLPSRSVIAIATQQHILGDTLRSVAVLIAAAVAMASPTLSSVTADAVAAVVVSIIIIVSLFPLLQGLLLTAIEIYILSHEPPTKQ